MSRRDRPRRGNREDTPGRNHDGVSIRSVGVEVAWACVLAGLVAGLYRPAPIFEFLLILGALIAIVLLASKDLRMRALDWAALLVAAYEIPSLLFSQYRANSIRASWAIAISVLVYYAVRLTLRSPLQIAILSGVLGLGGAWLGFSGLRQFDAHTKLLGAAGLTDLVAFRSRLISPPAPWVLGEWLTVLLLALPFACALSVFLWQTGRKWLAVLSLSVPLLIAASLSLSLSRAVFWSTVLFCLAACFLMMFCRVMTLRSGTLLLASALSVLAIVLTCESVMFPGVLRAYVGGRQTSQVRSTEGRIGTWKRSLEMVRAHPLVGVGSSNAALFLISTSGQEETTGFTSRTFSLPVQVLAEKGSIGFLLYAGVLLLVAREFVRSMQTPQLHAASSAPLVPRGGQSVRFRDGQVPRLVKSSQPLFHGLISLYK